jgi:succinyl-CoA synthetase beta subunit
MNIHEHQAKDLYRLYGIPTGKGGAAFTVEEAVATAKELPGPVWVVKAQIHAGGRGKGHFKEKEAGDKGGVRLAKSIDEVKQFAGEMLGRTLVTVQTGEAGRVVRRLYVEDGTAIDKEHYLSMLVDRATSRIAFIVSTEGGMDIEKVAHDTPEKIFTMSVDPASGFQPFHGRKIAFALGLKGDAAKQMQAMAANLYRMFLEKDMSLLEINPLVVTKDGNLIALDGKMDFDSNALFRHAEIVALRDVTEEELDVGGGASKEKVREAFKLILSDPAVEGILVNIFGGIMRCDIIADGVIAAAREMAITVPLVVRLEGTNVELGKKMLAESGLKIVPADDLADAARKITAEVKKAA